MVFIVLKNRHDYLLRILLEPLDDVYGCVDVKDRIVVDKRHFKYKRIRKGENVGSASFSLEISSKNALNSPVRLDNITRDTLKL
jgi:hypothetical protein